MTAAAFVKLIVNIPSIPLPEAVGRTEAGTVKVLAGVVPVIAPPKPRIRPVMVNNAVASAGTALLRFMTALSDPVI